MTTPDPTPAQLEIPSISQIEFLKERYSKFEKLGSGGMGTVFKAYDSVLAIDVAIKVLNYETLSGIQVVRFQQEAKAASKFSHPSLISILDFGAGPEGQLYLVMEYIEGQSLLEFIRENGPISDGQKFFDIFIPLAKAISYIHNFDVVHRDIKPSNIMILEDNSIKVIDFGIAKLDSQDESQSLTATGIAIGSPAYMSPEQVRGFEIDKRSDIYSFGCVMYKALVGEPVFKADSLIDVMSSQVNYELPRLTDNCNQVFAQSLESVYKRLTEKDPNERYQSFDDVVDALCEAKETSFHESNIAVEETESKGSIKSGLESKQIAFMSLLLLLAIGIGILYIRANESSKQTPTVVDESKLKPKIVGFTAKSTAPPFEKRKIQGLDRWTFTDVEIFNDEDFKWLAGVISKTDTEAIAVNESKIDGSGFRYISDCNLIHISASNTNLVDASMKQIAAFKNVVTLKIASTKVTDKGIEFLKSDVLASIDMNGCGGITNSGIRKLMARCPNLEKLRFGATQATPEIFPELSKLKRLREIDIVDLNLKDEDLIPLLKVGSIQDYDISGNRLLTDKSIEILSRSKHISYLALDSCPLITDKGIALFKKKFPNAKVEMRIAEIQRATEVMNSFMEDVPKDFSRDYSLFKKK